MHFPLLDWQFLKTWLISLKQMLQLLSDFKTQEWVQFVMTCKMLTHMQKGSYNTLTGAHREANPIPIPALNLPTKRSSRNIVPSVSNVKTTSNHPIACAILHTSNDGLRPILSTTHPAITTLTRPEIAGSTYRMSNLCRHTQTHTH